MSRLTQAFQEAIASSDADVEFYATLELNHPTFDEPIRVIKDFQDDRVLLLETGEAVTFRCCWFEIVPPGFDDDGPSDWKIEVDNVAEELSGYLDLTLETNLPIEVTFRAYRSDDLAVGPGELLKGYRLGKVSVTATRVSGTVSLEDIQTQAFPRRTYDLANFPGVHASQGVAG